MWPMDISNLDFARILKWSLIVLITGFIAQFGKSFATYVMKKIRDRRIPERREEDAMEGQGSQWPTPLPGYDSAEERKPETRREAAVPEENKTREKLEKKALKAQLKKQKKEAAKKDDTKA